MRASAIYEGSVCHRRLAPRQHSFRYRLFLMYLDLDELSAVFRGRWLWSAHKPSLAWFRRADYLGTAKQPLREAVLDRVEAELGPRPTGAVSVLTQLRTFGYLFNPVTFYFCHAADGSLEAIVVEITNTPWRERHAYVLDARSAAGRDHAGAGAVELRWRFEKAFHVSPFHDMRQVYEWCFRITDEQLEVHMTNLEAGREVFHAELCCWRRPITTASLARLLVCYPLLTVRIHAAIYWQAARLWAKRTPIFEHPGKRLATRDASSR